MKKKTKAGIASCRPNSSPSPKEGSRISKRAWWTCTSRSLKLLLKKKSWKDLTRLQEMSVLRMLNTFTYDLFIIFPLSCTNSHISSLIQRDFSFKTVFPRNTCRRTWVQLQKKKAVCCLLHKITCWCLAIVLLCKRKTKAWEKSFCQSRRFFRMKKRRTSTSTIDKPYLIVSHSNDAKLKEILSRNLPSGWLNWTHHIQKP